MKQELKEDLESLKDYQEHLCDKYHIGSPSWAIPKGTKKPSPMVLKELDKVRTRIDELSNCKKHKGKYGLDCFLCKLEGKF